MWVASRSSRAFSGALGSTPTNSSNSSALPSETGFADDLDKAR